MLFKHRLTLLKVLVIVFVACALMLRIYGKDEAAPAVSIARYPIKAVETAENVFAVTVNLLGTENDTDIELLSDVLYGFGCSATFFTVPEWHENNSALSQLLIKKGHTFGLLMDTDVSTASRREVMRILADKNDRFYSLCKKYPEYVRVTTEKTGILHQVLDAYRQYDISSSAALISESEIRGGFITVIEAVGKNTPYEAAERISVLKGGGMTAVSLDKMLYSFGSEVSADGIQKNNDL